MKMIRSMCTMLVCLWVLPVFAQDKPKDTMGIVRDAVKSNKQALIAVNMKLSDSEGKAFWPVYDSYQEALGKINARKGKLIADYAKDYHALSDEKGEHLLEEFLAIDEEMIKLKKSYLSKFKAVLPPKKVARYYQLENKIQAVIAFQLADRIPLVK